MEAALIPVVWTDRHRDHDPRGELWVGLRTAGTEVSERAEQIRNELAAAGFPIVSAERHADAEALHLHDAALVAYLADAWERWMEAGLAEDPGQDRVVPYLFPHPGLLGDIDPDAPVAATARAGFFAYDTMTLIGPGTWQAARAAVDAALTAADLVIAGAPAAYACCRPPGHHATRSAIGGSCYLNNAAAAASLLAERLRRRVAVLDVDAHHGNGTQSIFYRDPQVLTGSVHVDPGSGWFPHLVGFAGEAGAGAGRGANRNIVIEPGTGDERWLAAVEALGTWASAEGAGALVVALGVDAAAGDPESPLRVSPTAFRAAGRALGALGLPTVVVQEGGYDLGSLGSLVATTLAGISEGLERARG